MKAMQEAKKRILPSRTMIGCTKQARKFSENTEKNIGLSAKKQYRKDMKC